MKKYLILILTVFSLLLISLVIDNGNNLVLQTPEQKQLILNEEYSYNGMIAVNRNIKSIEIYNQDDEHLTTYYLDKEYLVQHPVIRWNEYDNQLTITKMGYMFYVQEQLITSDAYYIEVGF